MSEASAAPSGQEEAQRGAGHAAGIRELAGVPSGETGRVGRLRAAGERPQLADINQCLYRALDRVRNHLRNKATILSEYGDLPEVSCFSEQLSQVFLSLLLDAGNAIADRGEVSVRTWRDKGTAFVSVSHTGCGTSRGGGTGLGLSQSREIVDRHGGGITFKSEVGKRTTCTVTIPIRREAAPPARKTLRGDAALALARPAVFP